MHEYKQYLPFYGIQHTIIVDCIPNSYLHAFRIRQQNVFWTLVESKVKIFAAKMYLKMVV